MIKFKRIALVIISVGVVIYLFMMAQKGSDFACYLGAAIKLKNFENIYKPPFVLALPYFYSPLFALLLIPFSDIPFHLAEFAWLLFSTFLLRRIWVLCAKYFEEPINSKYNQFWIILSFLSVSRFIIHNIGVIQITIFILWAIFESFSLFSRKKYILGAALFALVLNIKILPITLIPYLIYRNKLKETFLISAFFVIYLYLPAIIFGIEFNNYLLHEWWMVINPQEKERLIESGNGKYGLVAMIPVFIIDTVGAMDIKRNFVNLEYNSVILIVNIIRGVFVFGTLAFLRTLPFKEENHKLKEFWEISYLLAITPLLFPHQNKYAFLLLFPLMIYLFYYLLKIPIVTNRRRFMVLGIPLIALSLIFTPLIGRDILGNFLFNLTEHYRLISFTSIILILLLYLCKPWKICKAYNPENGQVELIEEELGNELSKKFEAK